MSKIPVPITGLWLRREGNHAVVCVELDGRWVEVCREVHDGNFSHIVEPLGIERCAALIRAKGGE